MEIINWALAQIIVWIKPIKLIIILDLRPEGRCNKNSLQMNKHLLAVEACSDGGCEENKICFL